MCAVDSGFDTRREGGRYEILHVSGIGEGEGGVSLQSDEHVVRVYARTSRLIQRRG